MKLKFKVVYREAGENKEKFFMDYWDAVAFQNVTLGEIVDII